MTTTKSPAELAEEIQQLEWSIKQRTEDHEAFIRDAKTQLKLMRSDLRAATKKSPTRAERKPREVTESPAVKKAVEVLEQGVTRRELEQALDGIAKKGYVQSLLTGILAKKGYVIESTPDPREGAHAREKVYRIVGRR